MPTENRPNTSDMISVPRELLQTIRSFHWTQQDSSDLARAKARAALIALLAQPAEQHQGDPVAQAGLVQLPARREVEEAMEACDVGREYEAIGYNMALDDVAKLGPLYTHANPGEAGRLRAGLQKEVFRRQSDESAYSTVIKQNDNLRAQLANQADLLRQARQFVVNGVELGYICMPDPETPDPAHDLLPKLDAALRLQREAVNVSAAAQLCQHGRPECTQCWWPRPRPSAVERLSAQVDTLTEWLANTQNEAAGLHAQLANQDELLREAVELCYNRGKPMQDPLRIKIDAALSASEKLRAPGGEG